MECELMRQHNKDCAFEAKNQRSIISLKFQYLIKLTGKKIIHTPVFISVLINFIFFIGFIIWLTNISLRFVSIVAHILNQIR